MNTYQRIALLLSCNLLGIGLLSFCYTISHSSQGWWFDNQLFLNVNQWLSQDSTFSYLVALSNHRAFDLVSLLAMGGLYLYYFLPRDRAGRHQMIIIGFVMLLVALLINQLGHLLPIDRASPTRLFEGSYRISEHVSFKTKDSSADSFPGDHGLMLMIFAAFMWRYFGVKAFLIALLWVVIFTLPRILSGAHWFSDVYLGSLAIAAIGLSWLLLTPVSDWLVAFFSRFTQRYWSVS